MNHFYITFIPPSVNCVPIRAFLIKSKSISLDIFNLLKNSILYLKTLSHLHVKTTKNICCTCKLLHIQHGNIPPSFK